MVISEDAIILTRKIPSCTSFKKKTTKKTHQIYHVKPFRKSGFPDVIFPFSRSPHASRCPEDSPPHDCQKRDDFFKRLVSTPAASERDPPEENWESQSKSKIVSNRERFKLSHRIHVWYIYLHLSWIYGKCIGKYSIHGSFGYQKSNGTESQWTP